jgi:NAD(P)-dependent dehydrogenase (short-subunit alcohol dehydrogenase family)
MRNSPKVVGANRSSTAGPASKAFAAKAGLLGCVRQAAREAGEFGITVNGVATGLIDGHGFV